jgi:hypothetical protein
VDGQLLALKVADHFQEDSAAGVHRHFVQGGPALGCEVF